MENSFKSHSHANVRIRSEFGTSRVQTPTSKKFISTFEPKSYESPFTKLGVLSSSQVQPESSVKECKSLENCKHEHDSTGVSHDVLFGSALKRDSLQKKILESRISTLSGFGEKQDFPHRKVSASEASQISLKLRVSPNKQEDRAKEPLATNKPTSQSRKFTEAAFSTRSKIGISEQSSPLLVNKLDRGLSSSVEKQMIYKERPRASSQDLPGLCKPSLITAPVRDGFELLLLSASRLKPRVKPQSGDRHIVPTSASNAELTQLARVLAGVSASDLFR